MPIEERQDDGGPLASSHLGEWCGVMHPNLAPHLNHWSVKTGGKPGPVKPHQVAWYEGASPETKGVPKHGDDEHHGSGGEQSL